METCCGCGYGPARKSHSLTRIFKGRRERTGQRKNRTALRSHHPYLGANPFQGLDLLTEKRKLFPGLASASPSWFALPHWAPKDQSPCPGSGLLTRFPFGHCGALSTAKKCSRFGKNFSFPLGPTDPCSTAVHMEPFSTSVLKVLT